MAEKTTRYVILGFLARGTPLSGYELRKLIALTVGHFWNESFGQLYPELRRLTKAGLIRAVPAATGKRRRITYRITAQGRRTLVVWLERPTAPERIRNQLLLKVFFGRDAGRDTVTAILRSGVERWRGDAQQFALMQQQLLHEDADAPDLVYDIITLRHGRWVRAARLRWAEEAAELLRTAQGGNRALIARLKRLEGELP